VPNRITLVASPVLVGRRYRWSAQREPRRLASPGPRFPNPTATLDPITLPRPARGWLRGYTNVGTTTIRYASAPLWTGNGWDMVTHLEDRGGGGAYPPMQRCNTATVPQIAAKYKTWSEGLEGGERERGLTTPGLQGGYSELVSKTSRLGYRSSIHAPPPYSWIAIW
jgi:hypothetical protein